MEFPKNQFDFEGRKRRKGSRIFRQGDPYEDHDDHDEHHDNDHNEHNPGNHSQAIMANPAIPPTGLF
jgi:hypothetical protein